MKRKSIISIVLIISILSGCSTTEVAHKRKQVIKEEKPKDLTLREEREYQEIRQIEFEKAFGKFEDNEFENAKFTLATRSSGYKDIPYWMNEINWEDNDEMKDTLWPLARSIYVVQHLDNQEYLIAGLVDPIPAHIALYLKKSYLVYWNDPEPGRKEFEMGYLYARLGEMAKAEEQLERLEVDLGRGKKFYFLSYIITWKHVLMGNIGKSVNLDRQNHVFSNLENYHIGIQREVQELKSTIENHEN